LFLLAILIAGCAIGPNYRRPAMDAPSTFRGQETVEQLTNEELPWWNVFKDATLTQLIQTALTNNYDLRIAVTRVEQAQAVAVQAHAEFLPKIGYQAEGARGENAVFGNPSPSVQTGSAFAGVLNAAWEIDLWGRVRRLNEAARAEFLASEEAKRGVTLSLVSAVAQAYFELLALDNRLAIAKHTTESFQGSLNLFKERFEGGIASELESARAEAALATTAAAIPELEREIAIKENEISVLIGRNPGPVPRSTTLLQQTLPPEVPAGLPSELLERRPDILEAEQDLRAANAQIGVSLGDMLPSIGLTALFGRVSPDLSTMTKSGSSAWSLDANVVGPIFQGDRLRGRYHEVESAREEIELRYRQTALNAFKEVSDALLSREKLEGIREQEERAVKAYEKAVRVSTERYTAGKASYFEVLEAQQQLFPSENELVQTQLAQLRVFIQLYKALGGGWKTATAMQPGNHTSAQPAAAAAPISVSSDALRQILRNATNLACAAAAENTFVNHTVFLTPKGSLKARYDFVSVFSTEYELVAKLAECLAGSSVRLRKQEDGSYLYIKKSNERFSIRVLHDECDDRHFQGVYYITADWVFITMRALLHLECRPDSQGAIEYSAHIYSDSDSRIMNLVSKIPFVQHYLTHEVDDVVTKFDIMYAEMLRAPGEDMKKVMQFRDPKGSVYFSDHDIELINRFLDTRLTHHISSQ
jgi:multidrug efflux system outer membrane protein